MERGLLNTLSDTPTLKVDVSELLRHPGTSRRTRLRSVMEGLALTMARVREGEELDLDLRLDALVDGIHATGRVSGELVMACRRCLRDVTERIDVSVSGVYLYPGEEGRVEDAYDIVDETIDLEPLVRDDVMLALPLNPICREDCKGLCPQCGADRNEIDCGHAVERSDLRWSGLEALRERMED